MVIRPYFLSLFGVLASVCGNEVLVEGVLVGKVCVFYFFLHFLWNRRYMTNMAVIGR